MIRETGPSGSASASVRCTTSWASSRRSRTSRSRRVPTAQRRCMDAYLANGTAFPPKYVFIDPDPANPDSITGTPPRVGRHVNGQLCFFPRGFGHDGQFVVADDTYRESCLDRNPPEA